MGVDPGDLEEEEGWYCSKCISAGVVPPSKAARVMKKTRKNTEARALVSAPIGTRSARAAAKQTAAAATRGSRRTKRQEGERAKKAKPGRSQRASAKRGSKAMSTGASTKATRGKARK